MRILGIDPGLATTGWCLLDTDVNPSSLLQFGCILTEPHQPMTKRLADIYGELQELFETYRPEVVALETLFFVKNAKTLAQVGHTRGVILLAAGQAGVEVFEYAPRQIKMALTGFGGADKRQMQLMIQRLLNLSSVPQPDDAADAVAVALCHAQYAQAMGKSAVTV
ncbi:MAG: crossover junction endodeoxyribonuclease RuvC [Elusimicrobia bacterium]|nr:crossover junction endodeoxyribonuclease RuvC [Candidatus Obscuribacterium magneticum]